MDGRVAVLRRVLASRPLRRVSLAFLGFSCAEHGVWVAMIVYAYQQGGTTEAGIVAVAQLVPAAAVAPWASRLADRRGGAVGLWTGYAVQALAMGATAALLLTGAPALAAYAGAAVANSAVTLTRPAQAAVLPLLVSEPAELTAANAVTGWLESLSVFAGPALAGALIALEGPGAVFAVFAAAATGSAVLVAPIARRAWDASAGGGEEVALTGRALDVLRGQPGTVALLAVFGLQFFTYGAFDVLVVVLAIETLGLGPSGGGYLNAAFGAGGVTGGLVALWLVGRHRLVPPLLAAATAWGAAFLLIGLLPAAGAAFLLFAAAGSAWTVMDVAGRTLLQRAAPAGVRARVFGVLEGVSMLCLAAGSLLVPVLAALGGPRLAVGVVGALLVVLAAVLSSRLRSLDQAAEPVRDRLALLRGSPVFAPLGAPELEELARALEEVRVPTGTAVVRERERGDRFFLIADGRVTVTVGGARVRRLGPGEGFGEIALLRSTRRTATVVARTDARLRALDRDHFLAVVMGYTPSAQEAATGVTRLLDRYDPEG